MFQIGGSFGHRLNYRAVKMRQKIMREIFSGDFHVGDRSWGLGRSDFEKFLKTQVDNYFHLVELDIPFENGIFGFVCRRGIRGGQRRCWPTCQSCCRDPRTGERWLERERCRRNRR